MKRCIRKILSLITVFCVLLSFAPVSHAEEAIEEETTTEYPETTEYPDEPWRMPDTVGEAWIMMDASTGQILYEKNAYRKMYPASITKIMTALLAVEYGDFNDTIIMSEEAVLGIEPGSSNIALDVGEEITFEDAMYAVLLVSANEAAWAVAEDIAGSLDNFATMMNEKAEELGCVNTHFVNSHGLHDEDHYTCPYDMALITQEALKYDKFREITATTHYVIPPTNLQEEERNLWQNNKLIMEDSYQYYEYCEGGKTGFTDEARGTFVAWAKKGDVELIFVTMGNYPTTTSYTDARAMFEYFFNNYSYASPLTDYQFSEEDINHAEAVLNDCYDGENAGTLELSVDNDAKILIKNDTEDELIITYLPSTLYIETQQLGILTVADGNQNEYMSFPVTYSGYEYKPHPTTQELPDTQEVITTEASQVKSSPFNIYMLIAIIAVVIIAFTMLCFILLKKRK